jgi:hypothetical protein
MVNTVFTGPCHRPSSKATGITTHSHVLVFKIQFNIILLLTPRLLRVFENRVLRRIFGLKRDEVTGGWRNCIMRSCMVCTLHPVLLG